MSHENVVIIGAGPAGLTAAHELTKHGIIGTIVEADSVVGGISRTEKRGDCRFDIGGHRFFTKSEEVMNLWQEMEPEPMLVRPRMSRIYYGGKFFDYPLKAQNALRNLGFATAASCMISYAMARLRPAANPVSLEQWVTNQFGSKLYSMFFKTYTEKVWGIPCSEIGADWAAQRIKGLNLAEAVRNALFGQKKGDIVTSLIDEFRYPRLGPGQLWESCADKLVRAGWTLLMETPVTGIEIDGKRAVGLRVKNPDDTESSLKCTHLISSMPLKELVEAAAPSAPEDVVSAARQLTYRDFVTVGLLLDAESLFPDNWIYVHSPEVVLGRIQNFKNWSPSMVSDQSKTCLGLEYFVNQGDELWNMPDQEMVSFGYKELTKIAISSAPLLEGHVVRMPKAYPVYTTGYEQRLGRIREWLCSLEGIQCVGRNGQHRYNNMDHSMMTALIAARNIALGQSRDPWAVNEDAEYHETSAK